MGQITDTLAVNPASYDTSRTKYASVNSSYPLTNPIGKNESNTTYAQWNLTTGSSAESYVFYKFDCSAIPSDATINSVTCKAKAYISTTNSSRMNTRQIQLYANTTAKGSATTVSTSTSALTLTCGTWTRSELDNCYIRIYAKRGTSSTTTTYYNRFYGATLTVSYTWNAVEYTITTSASGNGTISPSGSTTLNQGEDFELAVTPSARVESIKVTDNGTDVSSSLVKGKDSSTESSNIASYSTSGSISGTYYQSAVGKGSDTTSTSTQNDYCSTSGSTADIDYSFGAIDIPDNATITSVKCKVNGHCENATQSTEVARLQLYSGTTAKGSSVSFTSSSNTVVEVDGGSWTKAELANVKLKFTIGYYGGLVNGATLEVQYTVEGGSDIYYYSLDNVSADHTIVVAFISGEGTGVFMKVNGAWVEANAVYKKVNGAWTEISSTDIDTELKYKKYS